MNTRPKGLIVISLLLALSMILAACQPATPEVVERIVTQEVVVTEEVIVTQEVEVERTVEVQVTPTPAPVDRNGTWVDQVVVVEEPSSEAAVTRLGVGELDVYAYTVSDPQLFQTVQGQPDTYDNKQVFGSYNEITFNPVGPVFESTGQLNPFSVPRVREAMNMLIDRNFLVQELLGGLGTPKLFPFNSAFPDYARYVATARELEAQYAHNPERAAEIITEEMEALGAEMVDGVWQFEGEPVDLILLIRTEDERREIGDYLANLLEELGFTVTRDYRTSAEASPIWLRGNPADGLYHIYTGGWITTAISRDSGSNFEFFYTPRGLPFPLWQAYTPTPEFDEVAVRLSNNDFATMEERGELFRQAMELALQDSARIWLYDATSFTPFRQDVTITADLAGGVAGTWLWAHTLQREGQVGGAMTVAMPSILTEPWNAIAGSNWIYDMMVIRGTEDVGVMPNPFTGLAQPQRIERAEVVVKEGLPVAQTLDWVSLEFVPEIQVPEDAWVDWDAETQTFITAGEAFPEGQTANSVSTVYYADDLTSTTWHDDSSVDVADFVMGMIMTFDRAKEASPIYDEDYVPSFESFMSAFKGIRIVSEDPLVIEHYSDNYALDAENTVTTWYPSSSSAYAQGTAAWHNLTLGIMAETNGQLAFSSGKAEREEIEYMSYISGPSMEILAANLEQAVADNMIPYEPTLGQYVSADEASARWANLQEWHRSRGHFWIGTGPLFLERAFPIEGTVILRRNLDYIDPSDKWAGFGDPKLATVQVDGAARVNIGEEATYDVFVTFQDAPYPQEEISEVKYLVFDATGALAATGDATFTDAGQYQVVLGADVTEGLESGANRLEVAVVSNVVSIPSFGVFEFVTVAP